MAEVRKRKCARRSSGFRLRRVGAEAVGSGRGAIEMGDSMSEPHDRATPGPASRSAQRDGADFGSVLVGVDGRGAGRDAIALGTALCARGGRMTLARVKVGGVGAGLGFDPDAAREEALELLEREAVATGRESRCVGRHCGAHRGSWFAFARRAHQPGSCINGRAPGWPGRGNVRRGGENAGC